MKQIANYKSINQKCQFWFCKYYRRFLFDVLHVYFNNNALIMYTIAAYKAQLRNTIHALMDYFVTSISIYACIYVHTYIKHLCRYYLYNMCNNRLIIARINCNISSTHRGIQSKASLKVFPSHRTKYVNSSDRMVSIFSHFSILSARN